MIDSYPKLSRLLNLAKPYLKNNDFGVGHTERVLKIAEKFQIPIEIKELVSAAIILHDVGGSSIEDQYEKGPVIARKLLTILKYDDNFIEEVCDIIKTHHSRLENPSKPFKILYDSDQLVKFSEEESEYNKSLSGFDWNKITESLYYENSKKLAAKMCEEVIQRK